MEKESSSAGQKAPHPSYIKLCEKLFLKPVADGRGEYASASSLGSGEGQFKEQFDTEIAGWCHGLRCYPGDHFDSLVHRVISELKPTFLQAIEREYVFDIFAVAEQFCKASKFVVSEHEVVFSILSLFPDPIDIPLNQQFCVALIIDQADVRYGDVVEKLSRWWRKRRAEREASSGGSAAEIVIGEMNDIEMLTENTSRERQAA